MPSPLIPNLWKLLWDLQGVSCDTHGKTSVFRCWDSWVQHLWGSGWYPVFGTIWYLLKAIVCLGHLQVINNYHSHAAESAELCDSERLSLAYLVFSFSFWEHDYFCDQVIQCPQASNTTRTSCVLASHKITDHKHCAKAEGTRAQCFWECGKPRTAPGGSMQIPSKTKIWIVWFRNRTPEHICKGVKSAQGVGICTPCHLERPRDKSHLTIH